MVSNEDGGEAGAQMAELNVRVRHHCLGGVGGKQRRSREQRADDVIAAETIPATCSDAPASLQPLRHQVATEQP